MQIVGKWEWRSICLLVRGFVTLDVSQLDAVVALELTVLCCLALLLTGSVCAALSGLGSGRAEFWLRHQQHWYAKEHLHQVVECLCHYKRLWPLWVHWSDFYARSDHIHHWAKRTAQNAEGKEPVLLPWLFSWWRINSSERTQLGKEDYCCPQIKEATYSDCDDYEIHYGVSHVLCEVVAVSIWSFDVVSCVRCFRMKT